MDFSMAIGLLELSRSERNISGPDFKIVYFVNFGVAFR